jgi:hypothetical protein
VNKNHKKTEDLATDGGEGIDEDSIHLDNVESPDNCHKGPNGAPECSYDGAPQKLEGKIGAANTPEKCDPNDTSGLPAKVFKGMYGDFCKAVVTDSSSLGLWWFVDNEGAKIPNRRRDLEERSPPVSANNYPNAMSYLAFETDDKKSCKMSCSEAFDTLIQGSCTFSRLRNLAKSLLSRILIFYQVVVLEENSLRWLRGATLMRVVAHTASRLTLGKAIPTRKPLAVWSQGPTD